MCQCARGVGHKARLDLESPRMIARSINKVDVREQRDGYELKRYPGARMCGEPGVCQEELS